MGIVRQQPRTTGLAALHACTHTYIHTRTYRPHLNTHTHTNTRKRAYALSAHTRAQGTQTRTPIREDIHSTSTHAHTYLLPRPAVSREVLLCSHVLIDRAATRMHISFCNIQGVGGANHSKLLATRRGKAASLSPRWHRIKR